MNTIKTGDTLPFVSFKHRGKDGIETFSTKDLFEGKRVLVIGVLGAFTPACTDKHLPDFVPYAKELKQQGIINEAFCISVADPYVLTAWAKTMGAESNLLMLTDTNAVFAKRIGLDIDLTELGLGIRSTRYAMVVNNGVIEMLGVEEAPQNVEKTSKNAIEEWLLGKS